MSKVLEGIDTCYENNYNGFNSYSKINSNFFAYLSEGAEDEMVRSLNGQEMKISDHLEGMQHRNSNGASNALVASTAKSEPGNELVFACTAAAIVVIAAGAIMLIRKRRAE